MGALDEALARIRGPRFEDLFADDAASYSEPPSNGASSSTTSTPTSPPSFAPQAPDHNKDDVYGSFLPPVEGHTADPIERAETFVRENPGTAIRFAVPFVAGAGMSIVTGGVAAPLAAAGLASMVAEPAADLADIAAASNEEERDARIDALDNLPQRTIAAGVAGSIPGLGPGKTVARTVGRTVVESIGQSLVYEQAVKALEGKGFLNREDVRRAAGGATVGSIVGVPFNLLAHRAKVRQGYERRRAVASAWDTDLASHVDSIVESTDALGGATYNPLHGGLVKPESRLHAVALPGHSLTVPPTGDLREAVSNFVSSKREFLDTGLFSVGAWKPDDGRGVVLDVVATTPGRSRNEWLGKKWDQEAIWDFEAEHAVDTGGSGAHDRAPVSINDALYDLNQHPLGRLLDLQDRARERLEALGAIRLDRLRQSLGDELGRAPGATPEERARHRSVVEMNAAVPAGRELRKGTTLYNDVVSVGAGHVLAHQEFEPWAARMKEEFPRLADANLPTVYEAARTKFAKFMARSLHDVDSIERFVEEMRQKGINAVGNSWSTTRADLERLGFPKDTIDHFIAFLSVTSANKSIQANTTTALRVFAKWYAKAPPTEVSNVGLTPAMRKMVEAVATDGPTEVGDLKIRDFLAYENDPNVVVVDRRVWRDLLKMPGEGPGGAHEYRVAAAIVRDLAAAKSETPREYFSHAWAGVGGDKVSDGYGVVVQQRLLARDRISDDILAILEPEAKLAADEIRGEITRRLTPEQIKRAGKWAEGIAVRELPTGDARRTAVAEARSLARAGERGAMKVDLLPRLAVWGAHQVLAGLTTVRKLGQRMVQEFGGGVAKLAGRAVARSLQLLRGARGAYEAAGVDPAPSPTNAARPTVEGSDSIIQRPNPSPPRQFAGQVNEPGGGFGQQPDYRVDRHVDTLRRKYGKAGELMGELLHEHRDLINEQSRGVVHDTELQKLADQVHIDLTKIAEGQKLAPGTAVSAEEVKAMADLVSALDQRLAEKLDMKPRMEARGAWSEADEASLVELSNAFVNAHTVLHGASSEIGRALRAHQVAKRLRDADVTEFLTYARQRKLDADQIAQVMRTHKDPLSRAKAVQAMAGLSASQYYTWARYFTMLMDPTTWLNAAFGNGVSSIVREGGKGFGVAIDATFRRGSRTMYARRVNPRALGLVTGLRKGFRRAMEIMRTGADPMSIAAGSVPPEEVFVGRGLPIELAANFPFRALSAADALSTSMVLNSEMTGFAYARAQKAARDRGLSGKGAEAFAATQASDWVSTPPEWLLAHANRLSRQVSLQSPLGRTGSYIDKALKEHPVVASFVLPFFRTRVNLVKQAAKATPLGFAQAARLRRGARSMEAANELAARRGISAADRARLGDVLPDSLRREATVVEGEAAFGSAMIVAAPLLLMAGFGDITGDPPADDPERDRLARERPHNAVRIGDLWVSHRSFGSLEPFLRTVGNAKQSFDTIRRKKTEGVDETWERSKQAFAQSLVGLFRAGPLSDLDNLVKIQDMAERPEGAAAVLGEYLKGATIVGEVADKYQRYADPYVRKTEELLDPLRRAFDPESLAPRLDPLGEPVRKRPMPIIKQVGDRPSYELTEAAKAGVAIAAPNERTLTYIDADGRPQDMRLSLPDRRALNKGLGMANRLALQKVVGDRASWATMDEDERRRELSFWRDTLRNDVRATAREAIESGRPINIRDLVQVLEDAR